MDFCSLHNHTEFSNVKLRDCIIKIPDLVDKALEYGYQGVAITDHEVLSGHVRALEYLDTIKEKHPNFKLIFGNEIYLIDESQYRVADKYFHFILLAKDLIGYQQIKQLSSLAWGRSYTSKGVLRTPTFYQDIEQIIKNNPGHVIASTACLGGELGQCVLLKDSARLNSFINWMISCFGKESCFLEMQDSDSEEQRLINETIVRASHYFDVKFIITSDAHYLNKEDINIHHAFLNSKEEKERETESFYKYTYVKKEEEIKQILCYLPEEVVSKGLKNTMLVYEQVSQFDFRQPTIVPEVKIPLKEEEIKNLSKEMTRAAFDYPFISKYITSEYAQDRYLIYQVDKGISARGLLNSDRFPLATVLDRVNTELEVLWNISEFHKQRMSAYLNLVKRITEIVWKVSLLGVGRGSAGGFLLNYLLGITQINPLEFDLPYWRFLNNERLDDFPDIDLDIDPCKTEQVIALLREEFGQDNVLNTITFKTETLKSAILTSARGLGINNDESQILSSMVKVERGQVATLKDCLGETEGVSPVPGFKEALSRYPGLLETIKKIEGLISGRGIHASSVYIFNNGYLAQNSLMRAPNKTLITAFDMHDSDTLGSLKFDLLRTDAETKLTKCLELLMRAGKIKWQGSLKQTYDAYLNIDKINVNDGRLWNNIDKGLVPDLFQFETQVGSVGIQKIQPRSILDMSLTNDAMRLQGVLDGQSPIERFSSFKKNINLWYKEMQGKGLTQDEIDVLKKYLLSTYGNSINQETLMRLLMEPLISGFSLREANNARKILAKKLINKVGELKKSFFVKGKALGHREVFLDYVWNYFIEPQMGYSFSSIHSHCYSLIGLQEAFLSTAFSPLYWACACLSVNAGSEVETLSEDFGDEEENQPANLEEEEIDKKKVVNTDYGKVSKAIGNIQSRGIKVALPDINEAQNDFIPDEDKNLIMYGLQAVSGLNDEVIDKIIESRPFSSLQDFLDKTDFTLLQNIALIKSGAFDNLAISSSGSNGIKSRQDIMKYYLNVVAEKSITQKDKLTMGNCAKLQEYRLIPPELQKQMKLFYFKKWIEEHCVLKENKIKYYKLQEEDERKFFKQIIQPLLAPSDFIVKENEIIIRSSVFTKVYNSLFAPFTEWLQLPSTCNQFYRAQKEEFISGVWSKYCIGSNSKWEMDTVSYYASGHELANIDRDLAGIVNYFELSEQPEIVSYKRNEKTGTEFPQYKISKIAGTILKVDNGKHIVTILTLDGVVDVKFFKLNFIYYNKKISKTDKSGKKIVIEPSWFTRGNKIVVSGFRRENMFVAKSANWSDSSVKLVTAINGARLILKGAREKEGD